MSKKEKSIWDWEKISKAEVAAFVDRNFDYNKMIETFGIVINNVRIDTTWNLLKVITDEELKAKIFDTKLDYVIINEDKEILELNGINILNEWDKRWAKKRRSSWFDDHVRNNLVTKIKGHFW